MKLRLIIILVIITIILVAVLSTCGQQVKDAKNWPIEDFKFTDHEGKPFGLEDLKGKVWVADFVFTSCDDVCLPMTANMSKLQKMLKEEDIKNVELVSFSVDPEIDTPEKLKEFGDYFELDFNNFHFLTGYTQDFIEKFALDNFKTLVDKPENEDQVVHQTLFYVVDQEGKIIKSYSGLKDPFEEIINDIKILQ